MATTQTNEIQTTCYQCDTVVPSGEGVLYYGDKYYCQSCNDKMIADRLETEARNARQTGVALDVLRVLPKDYKVVAISADRHDYQATITVGTAALPFRQYEIVIREKESD